jgi:GT2 family glycosyltransferase
VNRENLLVLITTHNRQVHLESALIALSEALPSKNFVVSLSNSGGPIQLPKNLAIKIEVLKVPTNSFWAEAMYSASLLFAGDNKFTHVLWLNEDVALFPNSISQLLSVMISSGADIVVGQTASEDGKLTYGGFLRHSALKPLHFKRIFASNSPLKIDTFNGNIVLLGPAALKSVGPFLSGYKHYLADIAYGLDATRKGLSVFVAPGFTGVCQSNGSVNPSLDTRLSRIKRIGLLNQPQGIPFGPQWMYTHKYGGMLGIAYFLSAYARFALTLVIYKKSTSVANQSCVTEKNY